jgi:hypothetical protein
MKKLSIPLLLAVTIMTTVAGAYGPSQNQPVINADISPILGPVSPGYEPDVIWDLIQSVNAQAVTTNLLLGAAYAGGYFWVSGGGTSSAVTTDNKYYRFSPAGVLVDSFAQPTNSGWGWRDLAYDGSYLYAGCEVAQVVAFDPTNGQLVPTMNFPKPASLAICRALAYDPATDHFWSGNFGSNMMEFDRSGNIIWQGSPAPLTSVYGMAWDANYPAGTTLWIHDQGTPGCVFRRFDPVTHIMTTETHNVPLLPGLTSQIAGGSEMSSTYSTSYRVMVGLAQGTPADNFFVLEMESQGAMPTVTVDLVPLVYPITIPASGGSFSFYAFVTNEDSTAGNITLWTGQRLPNGSMVVPMLGPYTVNLTPGTRAWFRGQNVPGSALPGDYMYFGYAGTYPSTIMESDSFAYTKLTTGNGPWVGNWDSFGDGFPGETLEVIPLEHAILSNYPNPFNPTTTIHFTLNVAGNVSLTVYDVNGRQVTTLVNGYRLAGTHDVTFDGSNLASGVYVYTLSVNGRTSAAKMALVK